MGVWCTAVSSTNVSQNSLPPEATVFSAELTAIIMAINQIKSSNSKQSMKFVIYSDSRSAVESLKNYKMRNPLVLEIKHPSDGPALCCSGGACVLQGWAWAMAAGWNSPPR